MTRYRTARLAAAAVVLAFAAGCATMQVQSYVQSGADFSRYRSYAWGPADIFATGDPRLDGNSFFHGRVRAAVDARLGTRGLEQTDAGTSDLLVHYHVSVTQRVDVNLIDQKYGYCEDCRPLVYDAGTMTVDLVDARSGRLVWRGWAERSIEGILDKQEWMEAQIDEAVARILERLPRRL